MSIPNTIKPINLFNHFVHHHKISFFTGVPDSLLKNFCFLVSDMANKSSINHVITANEGAAVAMAAGHYLATKKLPLIYTQNSGVGNMVNPLLSLTHEKVYSIPMLLLIGWRGEPGVKDEPQHRVMGDVQESIFQSLNIPYIKLDPTNYLENVNDAVRIAEEKESPVALFCSANLFEKYEKLNHSADLVENGPSRYESIREIVEGFESGCSPNSLPLFVGTTGVLSRELMEYRKLTISQSIMNDFLCVGNMGHAIAIANGIALSAPNKRVICLDGDGASLMHLGSSAISAAINNSNLIHILINNGLHESVGGQDLLCRHSLNFSNFAKSIGYSNVYTVDTLSGLKERIREIRHSDLTGSIFIEVKVRSGVLSNLGRPTRTPKESRDLFMKNFDY